MKKTKKIFIIVALCLCIFIANGTSIISYAQQIETVEPQMTYISTCSTDLSISDEGLATIIGQVRGKTGVTSAYVKVTLQR